MHNNKRNSDREKSFIPVAFKGHAGYLTDISPSGCQLLLEECPGLSPVEGEPASLNLEIPKISLESSSGSRVLSGNIAWKKNRHQCLVLGIHFDESNAAGLKIVQEIMTYWNYLNSTFGGRG